MYNPPNDLHAITIERPAETAEITIEPVRNYDRAHKTTARSVSDDMARFGPAELRDFEHAFSDVPDDVGRLD